MAVFFIHAPFSNSLTITPLIIKQTRTPTIRATSIPARDRVIDFGKHKGKMLGCLPSTYLKWVSNNLRARDFEHWAHLADSVLQDPVYQDRIEWEFAEAVLKGGEFINASSLRNHGDASADAQLLEISQRFGWDNDDRAGWRKVDFALLGTSKGGRIPKKSADSRDSGGERKMKTDVLLSEDEVKRRERRRERRERVVRFSTSRDVKHVMVNENEVEDDDNGGGGEFNQKREDRTVEIRDRFPGREGLLKKVINRKRLT